MREDVSLSASLAGVNRSIPSVAPTGPGAMTFEVTPSGPISMARLFDKALTADFATTT
jgi:hypothetical protein